MATPKSPFLVIENFISPLMCEQLVDACDFDFPDYDAKGNPIKMLRGHEENQEIIYERILPLIPKIEQYYEFEYEGMEAMVFEWYSPGVISDLHCENSQYLRKKWVQTQMRDFTGILFLSDYNDNVPFDSDYEVYGGKLEFPQHQFGFNPQRGTLIFYPSGPHFINANAPILVGDLYQAKIHIAGPKPYLYDPTQFPGDYTTWFK